MIVSIRKWVDNNNLVLIFITIYFLFSIIKIEHPGVNNDQLMFVNAATLNPDNMFLWKSFHGIPMMIFPYIGALKAYLYMPIFYLLGVNIWSIRLPQIILISITWFILYKTLLIALNKKVALLTILLLCLDPSIIAYSKIDQGPTVLEFLLKILAVYLLFLYLSTKRLIFFLIIFPILSLGIFNKLNFIWFINAFLISFLVFYFKNFINGFKRFGRLSPLVFLVVSYFFLIRLFMKLSREVILSYKSFSGIDLFNIPNNLKDFILNLGGIVSGDILFNTIYGYNPTILGNLFSVLIFTILFVGLWYLLFKGASSQKSYYFILLIIIIMIIQLLLTTNATRPWHALSIYPFFTIILASGILKIYDELKLQNLKKIFFALILVIVFYQIYVNFIYINQYSKPTKSIAYSSSIYDLIYFVQVSNKQFICLDVDICNQLLSFTQQINKYKEPFFFLDPPTYTHTFIKLLGNFKNPEGFLYISHSDANSHFPNFRQSFFKYLRDNEIKYEKVKEFKDGETLTFEIYKIGYF